MTTKENRKKIIADVASRINTNPSWLDALINFETAGSYSPTIKNPLSSARGLIQVIDSTAKSEFNVSDSLELIEKYPTFESQMYNVVLPYLEKYKPFPTKQSLYMAVFYPKYRNADPGTQFPEYVQKVNPGISTVQDYIDYVDILISKATMHFPFETVPVLIFLVLGIGTVYLWNKKRN